MLPVMLLSAIVNASPSMAVEPEQRDSQCIVAIGAEPDLGPLSPFATAYFQQRLKSAQNPEVIELLMITAEETILPNTNRREIATTCLLLYRVLKLQDKPAQPGPKP